ncbi:MAG: hypothetical protein AAF215_17650 [Cyanobacteria bacterium P01_A01_bin.123]
MSYQQFGNASLPAPCLVDTGVVVAKADMARLLSDLGRVQYSYEQDGRTMSGGEGFVIEVFNDPQQSTLVANHTLYLNVLSFDYLELDQGDDNQASLTLVQDNRRLKLVPLSNPLQEQTNRNLNAAALEAMVAEALSASWDVCLDDDNNFPT